MFAIVFYVPVIVDDINTTGNTGEGDESADGRQELADIEHLACEEQGYE